MKTHIKDAFHFVIFDLKLIFVIINFFKANQYERLIKINAAKQ